MNVCTNLLESKTRFYFFMYIPACLIPLSLVLIDPETSFGQFSLPRLDQTDKQQAFAKNFGMGNIYDTPDRRGIVVDLIVLFRDIHPKVPIIYIFFIKGVYFAQDSFFKYFHSSNIFPYLLYFWFDFQNILDNSIS